MSNRPTELAKKLTEIGNEFYDLSRSQMALGWIKSAFPEANFDFKAHVYNGDTRAE